MEENVDIVIDRRFKKSGMSWTTEGANNLLKLRTPWYNKCDWDVFWSRQRRSEYLPNDIIFGNLEPAIIQVRTPEEVLDKFVEEQMRTNSEVIGLSALMTTSMLAMPKAIKRIRLGGR
jgi:hypothetical protein